ncbi:MAG: hypothetical protein MZV65_36520 [Chromatiales bacterium]|nr:hypothetical protein [Chromatiales bacterium]
MLERCLNPAQLDAWFETVAGGQYTRTLLFSTLFQWMLQVVSRQQPSIHAAYQAAPVPIAVSVKSVYNQLNGLEPGISAALVRYSAEQATALIAAAAGARPGLLVGYRVKILDGNALAGREHRLAETRGQTAAPLPGKALVVFDPALDVHHRPGAQPGCLYPGAGLAAGGAGAGPTGRSVDRGPQLLHPGVAVGPARARGGGTGARARANSVRALGGAAGSRGDRERASVRTTGRDRRPGRLGNPGSAADPLGLAPADPRRRRHPLSADHGTGRGGRCLHLGAPLRRAGPWRKPFCM